MKRLSFLVIASLLSAGNINELFQAVKKTPDTKLDNVLVKEMKINQDAVKYSLLPKLSLFSSVEHFSTPANIKPMPPTVSAQIGAKHKGFWFSQNITKVGFIATMPLFVKEIYDNKKKLKHIISSTKYKAKLNLLKREALLVELVSKLNYLFALKKALLDKQNSIETTYKTVEVGIKDGRIPPFQGLRLKDALNQIQINITGINSQIADVKSKIYDLTNIKIDNKIPITVVSNVEKKEYLAIKPLKEKLKADDINVKVQKDSFYPKVMLKAQGYRAFAKAYNNDDSLGLNFASIGIYLNWNIFDKSQKAQINKAQIEKLQDDLTLQKTIKDLNANVLKIKETLKQVKKGILLAQNSIAIKEELLKGAKTAYQLNTMDVDEYLEYEDDLTKAKANLANLIATKNSLIANLAFIYGNNLERIFK